MIDRQSKCISSAITSEEAKRSQECETPDEGPVRWVPYAKGWFPDEWTLQYDLPEPPDESTWHPGCGWIPKAWVDGEERNQTSSCWRVRDDADAEKEWTIHSDYIPKQWLSDNCEEWSPTSNFIPHHWISKSSKSKGPELSEWHSGCGWAPPEWRTVWNQRVDPDNRVESREEGLGHYLKGINHESPLDTDILVGSRSAASDVASPQVRSDQDWKPGQGLLPLDPLEVKSYALPLRDTRWPPPNDRGVSSNQLMKLKRNGWNPRKRRSVGTTCRSDAEAAQTNLRVSPDFELVECKSDCESAYLNLPRRSAIKEFFSYHNQYVQRNRMVRCRKACLDLCERKEVLAEEARHRLGKGPPRVDMEACNRACDNAVPTRGFGLMSSFRHDMARLARKNACKMECLRMDAAQRKQRRPPRDVSEEPVGADIGSSGGAAHTHYGDFSGWLQTQGTSGVQSMAVSNDLIGSLASVRYEVLAGEVKTSTDNTFDLPRRVSHGKSKNNLRAFISNPTSNRVAGESGEAQLDVPEYSEVMPQQQRGIVSGSGISSLTSQLGGALSLLALNSTNFTTHIQTDVQARPALL